MKRPSPIKKAGTTEVKENTNNYSKVVLKVSTDIIDELRELNYLYLRQTRNNSEYEISNEELKKTFFYTLVQKVGLLNVSDLNLVPIEILFIARIAATSFSLHTLNLSHTSFKGLGPAVAKAIVKSLSISKVDMRDNDLNIANTDEVKKIFQDHNSQINLIAGRWALLEQLRLSDPNHLPRDVLDTIDEFFVNLTGHYIEFEL